MGFDDRDTERDLEGLEDNDLAYSAAGDDDDDLGEIEVDYDDDYDPDQEVTEDTETETEAEPTSDDAIFDQPIRRDHDDFDDSTPDSEEITTDDRLGGGGRGGSGSDGGGGGRRGKKPKKKKKKKPLLVRMVAYLFGLGMIFAVAGLGGVAYIWGKYSRDLPEYEVLREYQPPITTRVHAGDGSVIAEFARERRLFVPRQAIPEYVVQAFLSAEDKGFYKHRGVDPLGVVRAAIANIDNYRNNRRLEGASTITQQVAKNFLLTSDVKLERKIKEAILATRIEQAFTKDEILELYLNEIYLGMSSYGVAAAALNYFDKSLSELTIAEAAYLAAVPKAPNNYHPIRKRQRAIERRNWVIGRMAANGYITDEQRDAARLQPLVVVPRRRGAQAPEVEYFVESVRREVYKVHGEEGLYDGGLSIRATLDTELQAAAAKSLRDGLVAYDQRHGWRGALTRIEVGATAETPWTEQFDNLELPTDLEPWVTAVVLDVFDEEVVIGFKGGDRIGHIPLAELEWARPWMPKQKLGAKVEKASDVLAPGDVILVEPVYQDIVEYIEIAPQITEEDDLTGLETNVSTDEDSEGTLEERVPERQEIHRRVLSHYGLRQIPGVNGAIVAMDPHTGRVLALVGGFSFGLSEFNRVTQAFRQPGSSFKPFVYAAALDQGFTPSTLVLDAPFVIDQGAGLGFWKPSNYGGSESNHKFYGNQTLRQGLEKSRNVMTIRLAQEMGMDAVVEYASRFGIKDDMQPLLSMSLGAGETSLIRLTTAYAMMVNGGKRIQPTLIDRIQDRHGKTIYRHDNRPCNGCEVDVWEYQDEPRLPDPRPQVIDPRTAYQVVSMLEGVVQRGTGRKIRVIGKPLAGKTGTTNDERDAWFMGFSPDLAVGVFVGFDSPIPMGRGETGGGVAAPIFRDFMAQALKDKSAIPFRIPEGIRLVRVNKDTGLLAGPRDKNVIWEAFKPGTEPTDVAPEVIGAGGQLVISGQEFGEIQKSDEVKTGTGGLY